MSKYTFIVNNYHAIEKAEIILDGITVLSGENGSGKSTLSRWLYYVVKATNEYEQYVEKDAITEVQILLEKIRRASMTMGMKRSLSNSYYKIIEELYAVGNVGLFRDKFYDLVANFTYSLTEYFSHDLQWDEMQRLASYFKIEIEKKKNFDLIIEEISSKLYNDYETIIKETKEAKKRRDYEALANTIANFANSGDDGAIDLSLQEDKINLLEKNEFKAPLTLNRAIYYGTQRTMNSLEDSSDFYKLLKNPIGDMPKEAQIIKMRMRQIMNGSISLKKNDFIVFDEPELHYQRKDGLTIPLKQAATGLISFACLSRLLENGYLTQDTLLIIDEPEAHLHPQWIVEYARTLVLLNKLMGMKILISSHNPDMVSAIQSIARKEGTLPSTHFYLAQKSNQNEMKFTYENLGTDIGKIFESINIALSRIQTYGTNED